MEVIELMDEELPSNHIYLVHMGNVLYTLSNMAREENFRWIIMFSPPLIISFAPTPT